MEVICTNLAGYRSIVSVGHRLVGSWPVDHRLPGSCCISPQARPRVLSSHDSHLVAGNESEELDGKSSCFMRKLRKRIMFHAKTMENHILFMRKLWKIITFHWKTMENHHFSIENYGTYRHFQWENCEPVNYRRVSINYL